MDREEKRRVARFLEHLFGRLDFGDVVDGRGRFGRKVWSVAALSLSIVAAVVSGLRGFAGMEKLPQNLSAEFRSRFGIPRRLPDTTARDYVAKADWAGYRGTLRDLAKKLYRSKSLDRSSDMPIGMTSIDGKYRQVKVEAAKVGLYPYFQAKGEPVGKWQAGEVRTISVSAVSSRATICLDCVPVRGVTNEMGMFREVFGSFLADWGNTELAELVATDSGSASLANATLVNDAGCGYLMVLDAFQPGLLREAEHQLGLRTAEQAQATWTTRYRGKIVVYRLWRTTEMNGWNDWGHLRQVIRLERREIDKDGAEPDKVGTRYFLTNLPKNRLTADEWIVVIRRRWGVENETHWTLDVILGEDAHPWIRDPNGMLVVQMLRRIGLNILALYRGVHLRSSATRLKPWKDLLEPFYDILRSAIPEDLMDRRTFRRLVATT